LIENKCESFYFTVYTEKNDLEFEVVVDPAEMENAYDTYQDNLLRRDAIMTHMQFYEQLSAHCEKIILNGDWRDFYKTYEDDTQTEYDLMMEDLYMLLSRVQETQPERDYVKHRTMESFTIDFYIDQNALDYCKENLDFLIRLSDEYTIVLDQISELKTTYLDITILTKDGCKIDFFSNHMPSIWDDAQDGYAWNEDITEFVKRDTYISLQLATNEPS
jgi:hypothetical protein